MINILAVPYAESAGIIANIAHARNAERRRSHAIVFRSSGRPTQNTAVRRRSMQERHRRSIRRQLKVKDTTKNVMAGISSTKLLGKDGVGTDG